MNEEKQRAKTLLVKAHIYRYLSIALALAGVVLFGFIYNEVAQGNVMNLTSNPVVLLSLFVPFLPAAVFFFLSAKTEKKRQILIEKMKV